MSSTVKVKWYGRMCGRKEILDEIRSNSSAKVSAERELRNLKTEPDSLEKGKKVEYYTQALNRANQALGSLRKIWNENFAPGERPPY